MKILFLSVLSLCAFSATTTQGKEYESDIIHTSAGNLKITFIGHGSLMFTFGGNIIHIDPFEQVGDYKKLPKADILLITHEHFDHMDVNAITKIRTDKTIVIATETVAGQIKCDTVMHNGDVKTVKGLKIEAVPAYNVIHVRSPGNPFHPKGIGNGYVITFGDKRIYVAGDTENIPEMKKMNAIDVAFLPMNLPYTMTPEMVAGAAKSFKPKILYPYHYGDTDPAKLKILLKDAPGIELRIRHMQ